MRILRMWAFKMRDSCSDRFFSEIFYFCIQNDNERLSMTKQ